MLKEYDLPLESKNILMNKIIESRVKDEIKRGIQIMQYQINTLNTSNGQ